MTPRASELKSDLGSTPGISIRAGAVSGVTQRQDVNAVRLGSGPLIGPRQDQLTGARQDVGPGSARPPVRELETVSASRIDAVPDMRDPRQAAEMRRTVMGQGSVPRMPVCSRYVNNFFV
jgi:hypothetical protein